MPKLSSISGINLYKPNMSSRLIRDQLTVGRDEILIDTIDHLRNAVDRTSKHHFLFLGPRGIGKSHLLSVIEDRISSEPRLSSRIVVVRFPEESIGTLSFADILKQIISTLAARLPTEPVWQELSTKLNQTTDPTETVDLAIPFIRRTNLEKKRTIVVMIENLNELFSRQIRIDQQISAIRKFFMDNNGCLLIATATMLFDAITDVSQPFYDFFDTQILSPFTKRQCVTLLGRMRAIYGYLKREENDVSHCVMAMHDITGGNPRLIVMACELIVRDQIETAKELLLKLIDSISPTYQAKLAEMAPQERAIMETISSMRETTPRTPASIALKLGMSEKQTSALLKRLADARQVLPETNPIDKRSRTYRICDCFFDIWLSFQAEDILRRRIISVADFLDSYYRQIAGPSSGIGTESTSSESCGFIETNRDATDSPGSHRFLDFARKQIEAWRTNRSGYLESIAFEIMSTSQIASNSAIGDWYAKRFPQIAVTMNRKLTEPKAISDSTIQGEGNEKSVPPPPILQENDAFRSTAIKQRAEIVNIPRDDLNSEKQSDSNTNTFRELQSAIVDLTSHFGTTFFCGNDNSQEKKPELEISTNPSAINATQLVAEHASQICDEVSERLYQASLTFNTLQNKNEYEQALCRLNDSGMRANANARKKLLVRLANAIILDFEEHRIPHQGLDDALNFLDLAKMETSAIDAELDALTVATRLMVAHLQGDNNKSLVDLIAIDHPEAFANRVKLLFLRGEIEEAFHLVHHRDLDILWAETAAAVYVRMGRLSDAIGICESLRNGKLRNSVDPNTGTIYYFRCLTTVAKEMFRKKFPSDFIRVDFTTDSERDHLKEIKKLLEPIVMRVLGAGQISNGIERRAIEMSFDAAYLTGDDDLSNRLSRLLASANPISMRVPRLIHSGSLKPDIDLAYRLKRDWPNSIEACLSVSELIAFYLDDSGMALQEAELLRKRNLSKDQKARLISVLLSIFRRESGEMQNEAFAFLAELAGANHYSIRMAEAISAMQKKDWPLAERLLNERPAFDDPDWLSLRSTVFQQTGDVRAAFEDLKKLCDITSTPDALQRAIDLALKVEPKEHVIATALLERLSRFPNKRREAELQLAEIGWEVGSDNELRRAVQLYSKLYSENPTDPELARNAALCLRQLNEFDQALVMLNDVEHQHPEFVDAYLLHADLLETLARVEDAFSLLDSESVRSRFWGNRDFLHKYMHLGYMTDHELKAHQAMCQIRWVEDATPQNERTLLPQSLEQIVDFFDERRQFMEKLDEAVVRGEMPWTVPALEQHAPIISAWTYRTQKLTPWETLPGRATFCTYASNAFFSKWTKKEERFLEPIEPPSAGTAVVADLSSIITLYKLGLLEKAADYFGTIYIPSGYREIGLFDAKRLQPHQLSTKEQSQRLFELLIRKQLQRPGDESCNLEIIDYKSVEDRTPYTVGDIAIWLKENGLISNDRLRQLSADGRFAVSGREGIGSLLTAKRCQYSLFALQTLEETGLLEILVEQVRVTLTEDAVRELEQQQFVFEQQTKMARENRDLWRIIRDNNKFQYSGLTSESVLPVRENQSGQLAADSTLHLALNAYDLAKERGIPLLADDRVLLSIAQNESKGNDCAAFSTLELLTSLQANNELSMEERFQKTLKLIDWRYRFIRIDSEILFHAAMLEMESGSKPGNHLKKISRYMQDCVLDIGLLGGYENTTLRQSMAMELFAHWTRAVARFINELWSNDSINDEQAELLTRWAIDTLLPTLPASILPDVQIRLANNQPKLALVHLLSTRATNPNTHRSAKLMGVLQEALQLSEAEFCRTVFNLIQIDEEADETDLSLQKKSQTKQIVRRSIAKHALAPFNRNGGYQVETRGFALLEASKSIRVSPATQEVPDYILATLNNGTDNENGDTHPSGPLVFFRRPKVDETSVFEATDLLMHPNSRAREAVVTFLQQTPANISEKLKRAIKEHAKKISQKRVVNWYPAAEDLLELIENDWEFNLAGFRQALVTKKQDWIHRYWNQCTRPRFHPANTLPASSFHACTDPNTIEYRVFSSISEDAKREGIAVPYLHHLGHLPLTENWSLLDVATRTNIEVSTEELFVLAAHDSYFSSYHACVALVMRWNSLTDPQKTKTAKLLSDFICMSRVPDLSTRRGRFWACLSRLANHFLAWIPLYGPELGDDNSASLAWWMADRLAKVICDDVERKQNPESSLNLVFNRNIDPLLQFSTQLNQIVRGGTTHSVFHSNTCFVQHGGPFFASLIAKLKLEFGSIFGLFHDAAKVEVNDWLLSNSIHQPIGSPQNGSLLFVNYLTDIKTTMEQWELVSNATEEKRAVMAQMRFDCAKLTNDDSLRELLSTFHSFDRLNQLLWVERMKAAVWRKSMPLTPVLDLLRNQSNAMRLLKSIKVEELSSVIELMLSIQQYGGVVWKYELPHRMVDWLDFFDAPEEKAIIFNGIFCSSIAGGAPSAINRVKEREDYPQLKGAFAFQEDRLESARTMVPRWTWARLRIFLSRIRT
ncbi:MAG: tetratricopeptide repeat protein [Planctomycetaceae bacterium]|nr:tetratricopeptide repeat protein [Planctomycetaceae bacterium]